MFIKNKIKKYKVLLSCVIILLFSEKTFAQIEVDARYVILQDHHSGKILYEKEADKRIYPASLTKIMTAIIAFDLIKKGETSLDELITISEKAWRMSQSGYSSMFIMLNDQITVEDLLKGIIIISGNDACVALAEGLSGSEKDFVILMNEKAHEIGLEDTNFNNSSGINDPENYSTVRDILIMSKYLIDNYPEFYTYFKETSFTWDRTGGEPITQGNRNPLLYKNIGVDGIKTGYLAVEKYSLASSIKRNNRRLIAVGSGFETKNARSKESSKLLIWGMTNFDLIEISKKDTSFADIEVWLGTKNKLKTYINEDLYKTIPRARKKYLKAVISYNGPIQAPIKKNEIVGELKLIYKNNTIGKYDLLAFEDIQKVNIFSRLIRSINYLIWGDV